MSFKVIAAEALSRTSSSIPPDLLETAKKYIKLVLTSSKDPNSQMRQLINFWAKTIRAGIGSTLKDRQKVQRSQPNEIDELIDTWSGNIKDEIFETIKHEKHHSKRLQISEDTGEPSLKNELTDKAKEILESGGTKVKTIQDALVLIIGSWMDKMKQEILSVIGKDNGDNVDKPKHEVDDTDIESEKEDNDKPEDFEDKQDEVGTGDSHRIIKPKEHSARDIILNKAQELTRSQGFQQPKNTKEAVEVLVFNWIQKMKKGVLSIIGKDKDSKLTRISEGPKHSNAKLPRLSDRTQVEFFIYTYDTIKHVHCEELSLPNSLYVKDHKPVIYVSGAKSKNGRELPFSFVKDFLHKKMNFIYAAYVDGDAPEAPTPDFSIALMHFMNCLHDTLGVNMDDILIKTSPEFAGIGKYIQTNQDWLNIHGN